MMSKIKRPKNCGECKKFFWDPDPEKDRDGWCDNWAGVPLRKTDVCHPNFGIKKEEPKNKRNRRNTAQRRRRSQ